MEIQKFIEKRPFLYHLTAKENLPMIVKNRKLFSTNQIIDLSNNQDLIELKRNRRPNHVIINVGDNSFYIRDQRPISEIALKKCLSNNWECADFYEHLNKRVFTWPTIDRLQRHYDRYRGEQPIILVLRTEELFRINDNPLFCRLNSGATRANSYLGGVPPKRGIETFLRYNEYNNSVASVAEVTFENVLILPKIIQITNTPNGELERIVLD